MNDTTIFIFDAKKGMVLSRDVILPDGNIFISKGTTLTAEIIEKISHQHILEISITDTLNTDDTVAIIPELKHTEQSYFDTIRESEHFKQFNEDYEINVMHLHDELNDIVTNNTPINPDRLIADTQHILDENANSLQLFDMLHSMRNIDDLTFVHCVNVALIASIIGRWQNFSQEDLRVLTLCGLLHDIGKLMIPTEILKKPGRLTVNEYEIIKQHVNLGYENLKDQDIDIRIKEACLLHHEKCDGTGYPFHLKSEDIPDFAKIITIADVYDAMTSARVYRGSICPFEVIEIMQEDSFSAFDPKFAIIFLKNVVSSYINNDVRLSNGLVGKVVLINDNALSKPIVNCNGKFINLSKEKDLKITAII